MGKAVCFGIACLDLLVPGLDPADFSINQKSIISDGVKDEKDVTFVPARKGLNDTPFANVCYIHY